MSELNITDLKANPKNPRTISKDDYESLKNSIREFGDLSGVIRNVRTDQLVGGHQRVQAFREMGGAPVIEESLKEPNSVGTVARGYVLLGDEKFTYREVDWEPVKEESANVAANRIQGEFDQQLLAEITYNISQMEDGEKYVALTGQSKKEVDKLMKSIGVIEEEPPVESLDDEPEKNELVFSLTREQSERVTKALNHIREHRDIPATANKSMNGNALYYLADDYLKAVPANELEDSGEEFAPPVLPEL